MGTTARVILSPTTPTKVFNSDEYGTATVASGEAYFFLSDDTAPTIPTDFAAHYRRIDSPPVESNKQNVWAYSKPDATTPAELAVSKWSIAP